MYTVRASCSASTVTRLLRADYELPATEIVSQVERAILDWAENPVRDDLCLLVLKPR